MTKCRDEEQIMLPKFLRLQRAECRPVAETPWFRTACLTGDPPATDSTHREVGNSGER